MSALARSLAAAALLSLATALAMPVASPVAQRNKLPPTTCTVEPRTEEEVAALVATATPTPEPDEGAATDRDEWADSPGELPQGEPADLETVAQITAAAREFAACLNATDWPRSLALMTGRSIAGADDPGDISSLFASAGTPVPSTGDGPSEIAWVRVSDVRVLDDGRVGAVVVWGVTNNPSPKPSPEANFHIFLRVDNRWLLDEEISGNVEEQKGADSPGGDVPPPSETDEIPRGASGGFNEVDSAAYAEPTMAGAEFTIAATLMVGFKGNDDYDGVGCEMFVFERGAHSVTASAFCRADEALVGRPAFLEVEIYGPHWASDTTPAICRDAAPLAEVISYACTLELPNPDA
jgi:hypothetical protein